MHRLSNKPFFMWLLTIPTYLKYVATPPCNLSLMACFGDINVSRGSVATYAKCGWIFNTHFTTYLPRNLPVKNLNRLRFDAIIVMSLWPTFWPTLYAGFTRRLFLAIVCIHYVNVIHNRKYIMYRNARRQRRTETRQYVETHTHPFNGPLSRTTWVSRYQKGKTYVDFTEARDSEWQWHQLGHMQVCTSLQTDNHASTPPLCFL